MKRVAAVILAALFTLTPATSLATPREASPTPKPCEKLYHQKEFARYARAIYNHRPVISKAAKKRLALMRDCTFSFEAAQNNKKLEQLLKKKRELRSSITPFICASGPSAIPCVIMECESHGNYSVFNKGGSGAYGKYQLMPEHWNHLGRLPSPLEQDAIAAKLWAGGGGRGNWMC